MVKTSSRNVRRVRAARTAGDAWRARKAGGHLLECRTREVTVEIDHTGAFHLVLPGEGRFLDADLGSRAAGELKAVEE